MQYETIVYDETGGVTTIALDRPDKLNAMSERMLEELAHAFQEAGESAAAAVVVVKGNGRAFCSGYDIDPSSSWSETSLSIAGDRRRCRGLVYYWLDLWNYRKPVIGQVQGHCLGGGNELTAICDIVVAAADARFGHPAGRTVGIPCTLGFWPILIGLRKTKELLLTGDTIDAGEALRLGLVNRVVPRVQLDAEVQRLARRIAKVPPDALAIHKQAANRWFELMGLCAACYEGAELDAMFHRTESFAQFFGIAREKGLSAALEWRDEPFDE